MRMLHRLVAATCLALCLPAAQAQDYTAKPVRLVIPFPQAGTVDPVTRMLERYAR